jgi:multiple sugar transport system substrate-binding protein
MSCRRTHTCLFVGLILVMLLAACAPAPAQTIRETVEVQVTVPVQVQVTVPVPVTVEVPVTSVPPATATPQAGKTVIIWWSHWANQPANRAVIDTVVADYEAANPNVDIILSYWDIGPLGDALRATMTAGEGAPDISTDANLRSMVEAGWVMDLTDVLPWENFAPGIKEASGVGGVDGLYKFSIGIQQLMLFYNREVFAELGIEVPEDYTFTQAEFVDVVQKCSDAGYAGVANAVGNRNYPALFPIWAALTNLEGNVEQTKYNNGLKAWDTDTARQVLEWTVELRDAGIWPETFSTMTIDEFHVYFHTLKKSCMLYIPSWYTARAFKAVEQGGQSPDFQFGMLRYPLMDGAQRPNELWANADSGYMIMNSTKHPEIAQDILRFMAQPKYGALWAAHTFIPSAIQYDPATDWPEGLENAAQWQWYFEEMNKVYGGMDFSIGTDAPCGDFLDARTTAINQGLPLGLVTVDEAIEMLNAKLCPAP